MCEIGGDVPQQPLYQRRTNFNKISLMKCTIFEILNHFERLHILWAVCHVPTVYITVKGMISDCTYFSSQFRRIIYKVENKLLIVYRLHRRTSKMIPVFQDANLYFENAWLNIQAYPAYRLRFIPQLFILIIKVARMALFLGNFVTRMSEKERRTQPKIRTDYVPKGKIYLSLLSLNSEAKGTCFEDR